MPIAFNNVSGIVETSGSYTADLTGDDNLLLAVSIEGDNDESQTIDTHTFAGTNFTNAEFEEIAVGSNAIYSLIGWMPEGDITSGSQTYVSTLSSSPPSIGHSSVLLSLSGAHQTNPIVDSESIVESGVTVFPTHTFSAVAGQAVVYVVQLNNSATITKPADNGNDEWVKETDPWFIGGAFVDGAVFTLIATETHTNATFAATEDAGSMITSSHMYVIDQADAGISLIVNDINQSQSFDAPTLTQAHSLAVNDVDQNQTIDQPSLTQANILGVNDLNQNQSIDSPTLTQAHILTVNDITQSQAIDNVTLAVAGALLVDNLSQSQTVDLANIIQNHILSVNGLDQNQTIDQPSLLTGITVNDITQTQSLDLPTLTQANILSIDNLTQAQILDNITLGGLVVGFHKGEILVFSAYNGIITSTNAHTGEVKVFNAVDLT